jgi:protein-tyrosine phosphatase
MAREAGLHFERFPIPDRGVPASVAHSRALWVNLADRLRAGHSVGIHCRAGIGRSSLMAAGVLLEIGVSEDHAWAVIASARGLAVPDTEAQRAWVSQLRIVWR